MRINSTSPPAITLAVTLAAALLSISPFGWTSDAVPGALAYTTHCERCHQSDGKGIPGQYPSLHDTPALWQERTRGIRALLEGRAPAALGSDYMPTHGYLGNEIIAETLSYALGRWGPGGQAFTAEEVAKERLQILQRHPPDDAALLSPSPLSSLPGQAQRVTSAGPAMTTDEFARAREIYYARCTGCHGVLREGAAGAHLTPATMRERGTEYLRSVINYGSSTGMPNWGTGEQIDAEEIDLLARFLQHPVPQAPDLSEQDVRASWEVQIPPSERPQASQHDFPIDELFVVILHDAAQVAFIHGPSRKLIGFAATGSAPHRARVSASGRYLYVICRDGTLSLIDLFSAQPRRVAQIRIGFEARAVGVSRYPGAEDQYVMAGAYWPPQLVLLDGQTLEPLRVVSTRARGGTGNDYHPEPRVTDVAGSFEHPEFVAHIKETGRTYLFPYAPNEQLVIADIATPGELRAGSFSLDGRYYLTPSDRNAVVVLDTLQRKLAATIPADTFSGSMGSSYVDPVYGPVWLTSTITGSEILVIGSDPSGHPQYAWKTVRRLQGAGQGSLFSASHPRSNHIWVDSPLNPDSQASQSVSVFDKRDPSAPYRSLSLADKSGLTAGPRRILQPTYDPTGSEVWLIVWNPQDMTSAIVVVDDTSLEVVATLSDPRLTTPTRLYSLATLRLQPAQNPTTPVATREPDTGAELYMANCAVCHGTFGEGDGIAAPELNVVLNDLRFISARNHAVFPRQFVRDLIDGRALSFAHGPSGMPVWGTAFSRDEGFGPSAQERVTEKIDLLVDYIRSIQLQQDPGG